MLLHYFVFTGCRSPTQGKKEAPTLYCAGKGKWIDTFPFPPLSGLACLVPQKREAVLSQWEQSWRDVFIGRHTAQMVWLTEGRATGSVNTLHSGCLLSMISCRSLPGLICKASPGTGSKYLQGDLNGPSPCLIKWNNCFHSLCHLFFLPAQPCTHATLSFVHSKVIFLFSFVAFSILF